MITADRKNYCAILPLKLCHGFTLVELMVTLAVAAIAVAIAVPAFGSLIINNTLTGETNQFAAAFNIARNEAIKLNHNIRLCHSADGVVCSVPDAAGWQGWIVIDTDNSVLASGFFPAALTITGTANTDVIQFTAHGLVRSNINSVPLGGVFTICSESAQVQRNARIMTFVSGGRVSINAAHVEACA